MSKPRYSSKKRFLLIANLNSKRGSQKINFIYRSGKHILTACQDRSIRVYSVAHAKQTKAFKGSVSEDGTLIKVIFF